MGLENTITDPALKQALETSLLARNQAISLLDLSSTTTNPTHENQVKISAQQKVLLAHLGQLRGSHRDAHFGARATKALTAEARQEVDRLHLQLQNLYYEQRHLQGEITACESYEYVLSLFCPPCYYR
jgi:THO complex subunit 5